MTREEEIIEAGIEYTMQNSPVCIGGDNFYEQARMFNRNRSFEAGANWADEHPNLSSLWHPASEEPAGRDWKILCQNDKGECWIKDWADVILFYHTWNEYVKIEMIVKWSYVDELIK